MSSLSFCLFATFVPSCLRDCVPSSHHLVRPARRRLSAGAGGAGVRPAPRLYLLRTHARRRRILGRRGMPALPRRRRGDRGAVAARKCRASKRGVSSSPPSAADRSGSCCGRPARGDRHLRRRDAVESRAARRASEPFNAGRSSCFTATEGASGKPSSWSGAVKRILCVRLKNWPIDRLRRRLRTRRSRDGVTIRLTLSPCGRGLG